MYIQASVLLALLPLFATGIAKHHPEPTATSTSAPSASTAIVDSEEYLVAQLSLISKDGKSVNYITVTNNTCSKVPNMAGNNLEFEWFDGRTNGIQLYTDENCKNKGRPLPLQAHVQDENGQSMDGSATVKPADYGGENWGSVQALGSLGDWFKREILRISLLATKLFKLSVDCKTLCGLPRF